jgi:hypothetical protein
VWTEHVAHVGGINAEFAILSERPEGQMWELGIDGTIILKWNLRIREWVWTGFVWLRIGTSFGLL